MGLAVNLAHILVTGPLLVYVGVVDEKPVWVYNVLVALGALMVLYIPYVMYTTKLGPYHVWLAIHLFIFAGLIIAVGVLRDKSPHILLSLLLAIGVAAIGFHAIRAYQAYMSSLS